MQGLVKDAPEHKQEASSKKVSARLAQGAQHLTRANVPSAYSMQDGGDQARAAIIQEAIKNIVDNKNHASRCPDPAAKRQKISGTEVMTQRQAGFAFANRVAPDIWQANGIFIENLQSACTTHEGSIAQDGGTRSGMHENEGSFLGTASVDIPEYSDSAHDVLHAMGGSRHALVDQLALNTTAPPSQSHDQPLLRHAVIVPYSPSSDTSTQPFSPGCYTGETHTPQHGEAMPSKIISLWQECDAICSALEMSRMREESSLQMLQELRSQLLEAYRIMGRGVFA
jgi:hypothetical protein